MGGASAKEREPPAGDNWQNLTKAAKENRKSIVAAILTVDKNLALKTKKSGASALMLAAQKGSTDAVLVLIAAGANVNQSRNKDLATALHAACLMGHEEVVAELLLAGANPRAKYVTASTLCVV